MIGDPDPSVGSPNDGDLLTPTREAIAAAYNEIAVERAIVLDRINELRYECKEQERNEWDRFYDCVRPLEQRIKAMQATLIEYEFLRQPLPMVLERKNGEI